MTSSSFVHQGRRWAIAAAFVVTVGQKASAQVTRATAIRDTMATYTGRWHGEPPTMLARVATVLDSGFAAPERDLVLREMRAIRMRVRPGSDGHYPDKSYLLQVRFRGRRTALSIFAYWRATVEGPASYGHMGVSLYNMRVTEVMELRRSAPTDCRQ